MAEEPPSFFDQHGGDIIGAIGSIAGGLLGSSSAKKQSKISAAIARESLQLQQDMAKHGIRWRVEDAKAAGVHPLYALGAQLPSASGATYVPADTSAWPGALAQAGQHIGRAMQSGMTAGERVDAKMQALALDRAELENDLLRAQIAKEKGQLGPPLPSNTPSLFPESGDVSTRGLTITSKPMERTVSHPDASHQEPGAVAGLSFMKTPTGVVPVPSKDAKERIEDMAIPEFMWSLQNNLLPNFGSRASEPPKSWLPSGAVGWQWSYSKQEWQPIYLGKGTKFREGRPVSGPNTPERR